MHDVDRKGESMKIDPTWRMLSPGLWTDDEALHIDAAAYLRGNGFVPTRENQETLLRAFEESGIPTTSVEEIKQ